MGYKPKTLQNSVGFPSDPVNYIPPTICIDVDSPEWDEAYKNWISMKNPTKNWVGPVVMTFQEKK